MTRDMASPTRINGAPLNGIKTGTPFYTFATIVLFVGSYLTLILTGKVEGDLLAALIIGNLPSILSMLFSERVARDVRNGYVARKVESSAHEGARDAVTTILENRLYGGEKE